VKYWYFGRLKIVCKQDVLIPRPETEKIVDLVQGIEKIN
jgi:methylase of polypeptide subunit release factors